MLDLVDDNYKFKCGIQSSLHWGGWILIMLQGDVVFIVDIWLHAISMWPKVRIWQLACIALIWSI